MENNYQLTRIHNYVMGLMSKEDMYAMEREALEDPFLQDAIDGYRLQNGVDAQQLSLLQQRLARKLETKAADKHKRYFSWQRLTIGMAAAVLFLVACSLVFFKYLNQQKTVRTTEVILMEQDMRVQLETLAKADAEPTSGWGAFVETLNSDIRDVSTAGDIQVTFDVVDGRAKNISVLKTSDQELATRISSFIQQQVEWKGKQGGLSIHIQ